MVDLSNVFYALPTIPEVLSDDARRFLAEVPRVALPSGHRSLEVVPDYTITLAGYKLKDASSYIVFRLVELIHPRGVSAHLSPVWDTAPFVVVGLA